MNFWLLFLGAALAAGPPQDPRPATPAAGPDPSFWRADFLEQTCSATFLSSDDKGLLGKRVEGKMPKNRLYHRLDPLFGGVVWLLSDGNGNLDNRPLGPKTVMECFYGGIQTKEDESGMCEIADGQFRPLKRGEAKAKMRVISRLVYNGEVGVSPNRAFEWQVSKEFRLKRRPSEGLKYDTKSLKDAGRFVVSPGRTIPKFYRTEVQYWRSVAGDSFAIPKGYWMQPFRDGNFHQVRIGYHLEEWPGEPDRMFEVKDDESWLKVGKGDRAFYLVEKVRRGVDWAVVYTNGEKPPGNLKVSAARACPACTGGQIDSTHSFEDLESIPLEPE